MGYLNNLSPLPVNVGKDDGLKGACGGSKHKGDKRDLKKPLHQNSVQILQPPSLNH